MVRPVDAPAVAGMRDGLRPLRRVSLIFFVLGACGAPWNFAAGNYRGLGYVYLFAAVAGLVFLSYSLSYLAGYRARQRHVTVEGVHALAHLEISPEQWEAIPPAPAGQGYLYVIKFSSGTIKVGRAAWPAQRLGEHRRHGWAFGVVIVRAWVSAAHEGYEITEARLIDYAASTAKGDRARREFFHGADFDALAMCAAELAGAPGLGGA